MKKNLIVCATFITLLHASEDDAWRKKAFEYVYEHNVWKNKESGSGPGSTQETTHTLRSLLPAILQALNVQTFIDAGCGDLNWLKDTPLQLKKYIGIDIVQSLIEQHAAAFASDQVQFLSLDITKDALPRSDLIFCRDVLQHLSLKDIKAALANIKKSGARYLMTTTYTNIKSNDTDIRSGNFRMINLSLSPFNFPQPIIAFDELSAEPEMKTYGKRMCVWRILDLP